MKTTNFDKLTANLKRHLEYQAATLEQRKAAVATGDITELAYTFRQRCDDVMKEGEVYAILLRINRAHENVCRTAVELVDPEDEKWWSDKARHLVRWIAEDCMRTIVRGVSTSSNPIYIVEEMMKVEAAKQIFGMFVSGYIDSFFDADVFEDIFDGMERRERELEAKLAKRVAKVLVHKFKGTFSCTTVNHAGQDLKRDLLLPGVLYKKEAMERAEQWAEEIRQEQQEETRFGWNSPYITVEFKS